MRISKKLVTAVLVLAMMMSSMVVNAQVESENETGFTDVARDHWAYDHIQLMSKLEIINGYDDGTFRPSATVSRAEFAKMMVKTMNLQTSVPETPTFIDVAKSDWEYEYVESATGYLTGFQSTMGLKFKPDDDAVREDMAVAIVKGLKISPLSETDSNTALASYSDSSEVSDGLRNYVATAIQEGIMIGDGTAFTPQGSLTRAQSATLLARLLVDEKIVLEEETKIVIDDFNDNTKTPKLTASKSDGDVVLEWTKVPSENFKYYKVVISATDSSPSYPSRGSALPLSGVDNNRYVLESGMSHSGLVLKGGSQYYVAITAVYENEVYNTSNVETVIIPGDYTEPSAGDRTPALTYDVRDEFDDVVIEWSQVDSSNFKYYKVVVSKYDSTPQYSENGYAKAISNVTSTRWELSSGDSYNNGDFGGTIKGGETYYVAITAVYNDGKYTSNVKQITIPGTYTAPNTGEMTPVLSATVKDEGVKLQWTATEASNFHYYKVVLSKYDSTPAYPGDGYLTYISNASTTSYFVQEGQGYNGGDFGGSVDDETYYMTITAVYDSGKYTSNTVVVTVPDK